MRSSRYTNIKREYGEVYVENNKRCHVESKVEVHIHNDRKVYLTNLKDILPELLRIGKEFKKSIAAFVVTAFVGLVLSSINIYSSNTNYFKESLNINDEVIHNYRNQSVMMPYEGWNSLKIVTRDEWIAEPARSELDRIIHPVPHVVITHTASEACIVRSRCVFLVRQIQNFHTEGKHWFDIGYNFLVGGDGYVYYGRGWDHVGAFAKGFNKVSIGIAMIGTFITQKPTEKQISAVKMIINEGVRLKKLSNNYRLLAHCNVSSTTSPGLMVYNEIQAWPNFSQNPI